MSKSEKQKIRTLNKSSILEAIEHLERNGYTISKLNHNPQGELTHIRVNGMLDIYTANKKYHNLKTYERGSYTIDHFDFITQYIINHG